MVQKQHQPSATMLAKMRQGFFEVDARGVLVYMDPMIGPLCNARRLVMVRYQPAPRRLELSLEGTVVQRFDLDGDPVDGCRAAFHAYFVLFTRLCRSTATAIMAIADDPGHATLVPAPRTIAA